MERRGRERELLGGSGCERGVRVERVDSLPGREVDHGRAGLEAGRRSSAERLREQSGAARRAGARDAEHEPDRQESVRVEPVRPCQCRDGDPVPAGERRQGVARDDAVRRGAAGGLPSRRRAGR